MYKIKSLRGIMARSIKKKKKKKKKEITSKMTLEKGRHGWSLKVKVKTKEWPVTSDFQHRRKVNRSFFSLLVRILSPHVLYLNSCSPLHFAREHLDWHENIASPACRWYPKVSQGQQRGRGERVRVRLKAVPKESLLGRGGFVPGLSR